MSQISWILANKEALFIWHPTKIAINCATDVTSHAIMHITLHCSAFLSHSSRISSYSIAFQSHSISFHRSSSPCIAFYRIKSYSNRILSHFISTRHKSCIYNYTCLSCSLYGGETQASNTRKANPVSRKDLKVNSSSFLLKSLLMMMPIFQEFLTDHMAQLFKKQTFRYVH